jgi:hypothetical protein
MLSTAYRYLAVVILIGLGFGLIADSELWRSGRQDGSVAREHQARTEPGRAAQTAEEDEVRRTTGTTPGRTRAAPFLSR